MKPYTPHTVFLCLLMILVGAPVAATTIDFESLPSGDCAFLGGRVYTQGFLFSKGEQTHGFWACDASGAEIRTGNNSTRALINANKISNPGMTSVSGIPFSLLSFDAGSRMYPIDYRSESLLVTGLRSGGGFVTERFLFRGTDFDTFILPSSFTNLIAVSWLAETSVVREHSAFLLDNVVVASIPVPASGYLIFVGLAALAVIGRQRGQATKGPG